MLLKDLFKPDSSVLLSCSTQEILSLHGLEGWVLEQKKISLESDLLTYCQSESIKYALRYEIFSRELHKFLKEFSQAFPIKGMSLIPRFYKNPIIRRVTDIDLFYPYDLTSVKKYFIDHDFLVHEEKWEANSFKLNASKVIDGIEVPFEIHQKLLWNNHCEWNLLNLEDELIYLCGHLAFQHTFFRANWLFDLAMIINVNPIWDTKRLDYLLENLNLKNSFSSCLWVLENILKIELPIELKKFVLGDYPNKLIQKILTDDFLIDVTKSPARYYLLKHLLKDTLTQSFTYDILWFKQKLKNEFKSK